MSESEMIKKILMEKFFCVEYDPDEEE